MVDVVDVTLVVCFVPSTGDASTEFSSKKLVTSVRSTKIKVILQLRQRWEEDSQSIDCDSSQSFDKALNLASATCFLAMVDVSQGMHSR